MGDGRPRQRTVVLLVAVVLALLSTVDAVAGEWTGNVSLSLGTKRMNKEDWGPREEHSEYGIEVSWGKQRWPLRIATDFLVSSDEQTVTDPDDPFTTVVVVPPVAETSEIALGVRKVWSKQRVHGHLGSGLAFVLAELNGEAVGLPRHVSETDIGTGAWLGAGIFWRIGPRWGVGLGARLSRARVELFGNDKEAGGWHAAVSLGWNWPAGT